MDVISGVIWAADFEFDNISYKTPYVRRRRVGGCPPWHENYWKFGSMPIWVSFLGLFGLLISISTTFLTKLHPFAAGGSAGARRDMKITENFEICQYGCHFWSYLGCWFQFWPYILQNLTSPPTAGRRVPALTWKLLNLETRQCGYHLQGYLGYWIPSKLHLFTILNGRRSMTIIDVPISVSFWSYDCWFCIWQ